MYQDHRKESVSQGFVIFDPNSKLLQNVLRVPDSMRPKTDLFGKFAFRRMALLFVKLKCSQEKQMIHVYFYAVRFPSILTVSMDNQSLSNHHIWKYKESPTEVRFKVRSYDNLHIDS